MKRTPGEPLTPPEFCFCPACGADLARDPVTTRPTCEQCGFVHYLNPIAVVAGVLLSKEPSPSPAGTLVTPEKASHILLVRRTVSPSGRWCIPCGYLEYDEDVHLAVAREMREETGLGVDVLGVLAVRSNFHRPLEQSVGTWFLTRRTGGRLQAGDDADRAEFFPLPSIPVPLAFPTDREVIELLVRMCER